jgi:hypothetical protein
MTNVLEPRKLVEKLLSKRRICSRSISSQRPFVKLFAQGYCYGGTMEVKLETFCSPHNVLWDGITITKEIEGTFAVLQRDKES